MTFEEQRVSVARLRTCWLPEKQGTCSQEQANNRLIGLDFFFLFLLELDSANNSPLGFSHKTEIITAPYFKGV